MTLSLSLQDLERGEVFRNIAQSRISDWKAAAMRKSPIRIKFPITMGKKVIRVVVLTGIEPKDKGFTVRFAPAWGRCYRGCHARREDLRILVVEFHDETMEFDDSGVRNSKFTTNGFGVGRESEEAAEALFAILAEDDSGNAIVRSMLAYVSKKYGTP